MVGADLASSWGTCGRFWATRLGAVLKAKSEERGWVKGCLEEADKELCKDEAREKPDATWLGRVAGWAGIENMPSSSSSDVRSTDVA